jgi:hypothetical protein
MTTAQQIQQAASLTYRQVDNWTKQGYLRVYSGAPTGTGNPRSYPYSELMIAQRMAALIEVGFTTKVAHDLARGDDARMQAIDLVLASIRIGLSIDANANPHPVGTAVNEGKVSTQT